MEKKNQPEYKGKCRLDDNQLIIKGNKYSIETLHRLPSDIAPYKAAQINSETCLVLHGQHTPLSDFHISPFILDDHQFHSAEQYIQYKKACHFSDYISSEKILQCHNPYDAKTLSRNILNFDRDTWKSFVRDACLLGICAKFEQNPSLLQFLKATKLMKLAESCYDKLWGTGLSLYDQNALKPSHWINQGLLGEILMEICDNTTISSAE